MNMTKDIEINEGIDLASRKCDDNAFVSCEVRYRCLFETVQFGIMILDGDTGKVVDVNPFMTKLTGYLHEEFFDKYLWEIGPFKDAVFFKKLFADLQSKECLRYDSIVLATRDGLNVPIELTVNLHMINRKKMICFSIRDISKRKQAEESFRVSEQMLAGIFLHMRDVVWSLSWPDLGVLFISHAAERHAAERVFGRPSQDFVANPSLWQDAVYPEDFHTVEAAINDLKKHGSAERTSRIVKADGSIAWILDRSWLVFDNNGRATRVDGIVTDITARIQADAERMKLEKQLWSSQKMDAIGSLAGGVAHDFNNLLSVIMTYAGFVMESLQAGDPLWEDLLEIEKAGKRAAALTNQLLAFSRKQILVSVPLCLNTIATGIEKMLRRILGEDIELVIKLEPELGLTTADPGQMEQVLMNLAVNARDAMPKGGKLTIETSNLEIDEEYTEHHAAVKLGSYVQLIVTDTGCGMDEQTKERIFEPFFTTKEKGKGTGLGLATVYGIVRQSGGDIWVNSEVGRGTSFSVYLPRDHTATEPLLTRSTEVQVETETRGAETILVVEDEDMLLTISRRALEAAGYKVLTASNGEDALLMSAQYKGDIHLLVTDVVMPRMGGMALAQELLEVRPSLKILYISGYTDDAVVNHGVLNADIQLLPKPFTAALIARKVRMVLDMPS